MSSNSSNSHGLSANYRTFKLNKVDVGDKDSIKSSELKKKLSKNIIRMSEMKL